MEVGERGDEFLPHLADAAERVTSRPGASSIEQTTLIFMPKSIHSVPLSPDHTTHPWHGFRHEAMNDSYDPFLSSGYVTKDVQSSTKKRKRADDEHPARQPDIIHVLPDTSSKYAHESLQSLCVIKRSQLPLSYLNPSFISCRRFKAAIGALEETSGEPRVLIARGSDDSLHAIERIEGRQYALCSLASHVTPAAIHALGNSSQPDLAMSNYSHWRDPMTLGESLPARSTARKAPRLSMLSRSGQKTPVQQQPPAVPLTDSVVSNQTAQPSVEIAGPPEDPQLVFHTFIQQYLEMLYKSRTSVAYLAKVHLSRLRAASCFAGHGRVLLKDFLEGIVLSSSVGDKKYKKTWPEKLLDVGPTPPADNEAEHGDTSKRKKQAKPKVKVNKQGLLANEDKYFLHWWFHGEEMPPSNELADARFKRRSLSLRTREAFLQIVVLLEILSLDTPSTPPVVTDQPTQPSTSTIAKAKDCGLVLELLLDKLSIWHSLEHGGLLGHSEDKPDPANKAPDHLRNFCIEVVTPYYASRIPERAAIVNQKLGGPSAPSPSALRTSKLPDGARRSKTSKSASQRSSDDRRSQMKRNVNLPRSNTDPILIPGLKKEPSEISLNSLPQFPPARSVSVRSSAVDKMRMKHREVDFNALSQAQEHRRKKQAEVESKLQEAISALKRPNRALAGKEMADVAQQRERMAQARQKG